MIVFVIGDHAAPLYNIVSYNVYERLLGLSLTPWSERQNAIRLKNKEAGRPGAEQGGQRADRRYKAITHDRGLCGRIRASGVRRADNLTRRTRR